MLWMSSIHLRLVSRFLPLPVSFKLSPILTLYFPGFDGSITFLGAPATTGGILMPQSGREESGVAGSRGRWLRSTS